MCATTPGNIQGVHYDGPTSCADWVSIVIQSFGGEKRLTWYRDRFSAFGRGEYGTSRTKVAHDPEVSQYSLRIYWTPLFSCSLNLWLLVFVSIVNNNIMCIVYSTVFIDYTHIVVGMMLSVRPHTAVLRSSLHIYARVRIWWSLMVLSEKAKRNSTWR